MDEEYERRLVDIIADAWQTEEAIKQGIITKPVEETKTPLNNTHS